MAGFKKVLLTEREDSLTQKVEGFEETSTPVFDNSYTSTKLNDLYKEFDAITLDENTLELAKEESVAKVHMSTRQKIYLSAGIVIAILMLFMAIYNIFVINSLNSDIDILQKDIAKQEYDIASKTRNLDNLTSASTVTEDLVSMGYSAEAMNGAISISMPESTYQEDVEINGNWWDSFCDFISSIFGG